MEKSELELENDKYITKWFNGNELEPRTRKNYILGMKHYTEYTGKSPIELIQDAEADIKSDKLPRDYSIKHYLIEFREQLKSTGISDNSVRTYLASIKSFYSFYDIPIPNIASKRKKVQPSSENLKIPSLDDVRVFLKHCDVREKAIVLVGLSSGLSANEIANLKISDFKNGYDKETKITTLTLRRGKTGVNFTTFLTPETSEAIWDYLTYRNRKIKFNDASRKNAALKKQFTDDSNYLFIRQIIDSKFLENGNDELRHLNGSKSLGKIYHSINTRLGNKSTNNNRHLIRSHTMRKLFNTILKTKGCNNTMVECWMGHSLGPTDDAYFKPSVEEMVTTYSKYIPYLTVQKELDVSKSPEYQRVVEEKGKVEGELIKSVIERSEMQELKSKITEQEVKIAEYSKDNEIFVALLDKLKEKPEILQKILQIEPKS